METNLKMHLETVFRNLLKQSVIIGLLFLGHNIGATEYIYDSKGKLKEIRTDTKPYYNPNNNLRIRGYNNSKQGRVYVPTTSTNASIIVTNAPIIKQKPTIK